MLAGHLLGDTWHQLCFYFSTLSPTSSSAHKSLSLGQKIMKIFNWVHRRFNNKGENAKKNGDSDVEQFQDENKCNDVFERWGGAGILTIGTFGYDPLLKHEDDHDIFFYQENALVTYYQSHDDDDEDEEEEVVLDDEEEDEEKEEEKPLVLGGYLEDIIIEREDLGFEYMMMEKRERTTLADLFSADHTMENQPCSLKKGDQLIHVKEKLKAKPGPPSFTKKLKIDEARPIHKLNQLMRRMLKRKIHPVVNSKVAVVKEECATNDHASLLPISDAII